MSQASTRARKLAETPEQKPAARGTCVHHWVIESPNGRESTGLCKRCGARKSFTNSTEQVMWEQTNTLRNDLSRSVRSSKTDEYSLADET